MDYAPGDTVQFCGERIQVGGFEQKDIPAASVLKVIFGIDFFDTGLPPVMLGLCRLTLLFSLFIILGAKREIVKTVVQFAIPFPVRVKLVRSLLEQGVIMSGMGVGNLPEINAVKLTYII